MEKIQDQTHSRETITYSLARLLERLSYYGIRSLLFLYMLGETINLPREEASKIYGIFMGSMIFSQILGAIIGDLATGNKKAMVIGGIMQALGALCFCIPDRVGLYLGLCLIVLGGGLYSPNVIAHFCKLYLNKIKLLDSGFTIFYLAVNIGAFLGAFLIALIGNKFGLTIGFITASLLLLLSVALVMFSKEPEIIQNTYAVKPLDQRIIKTLIAIVVCSLFWFVYEISGSGTFDLQMKFLSIASLNLPDTFFAGLDSAFILPVCIVMAIIWSFYYVNPFIKLTIGFILCAISFALLITIPASPSGQHLVVYVFSIMLFRLSEVHVAPIVHSVLTQYTNPKYLAIVTSLALVPPRLLSFLIVFFESDMANNPSIALKIASIATLVIGLGLLVYVLVMREHSSSIKTLNNDK